MTGRRWLYLVVSLALAVAMMLLFGLLWTTLLIAALLACPLVLVWSHFMARRRTSSLPLGPALITRGDTRYFDWVAPWYDLQCSVFGLGARFRGWTLALAQPVVRRGDRVLDAGCGNGVLTRRIADIVGPTGEVWGIDPAPDMVRVAMQEAGRTRNAAQFRLAAMEALPFEDASFDVGLVSLVLHHLPPDLKVIGLREVYRVLKSGGCLLVVEPDRPDHRLWRILFWPMRLYRNLKEHLEGRTAELLQRAGFVSVTELGRWAHWLTFWSARKPV